MSIDFEKKDNIALYKQVKNYILQNIEKGHYPLGEVLPTERELCDKLEVSRYTVRKGIQELVQEGVLYRVQGSGTYVYEEKKEHRNDIDWIGVIVNYIDNEMEARIFSGIDNIFSDTAYHVSLKSSQNKTKKEAELIQMYKNEGVKGLVIMPSEEQKDSSTLFDLKREGFPFVLVDRKLDDCITDSIVSDNIQGGFIAAEHLVELGHEKIGFVKRKYSETSSIKKRIMGYKKALNEYGLEFNENYIYTFKSRQNKEKENNILNYIKKNKLTGIVVLNDFGAVEIIKIARKNGIDIPEDLSLVSFDNLRISRQITPSITTVAQNLERMGEEAAKRLLEVIETDTTSSNIPIVQKTLPVNLCNRQSTGQN